MITHTNIITFIKNNRYPLILILVLSLLILTIIICIKLYIKTSKTVSVGILFTTNGGVMAENEKRLSYIVNKIIDIYNKSQNKIYLKKYNFNPESSTKKYEEGAYELIKKDVALVFGCWRSIDRKIVLPIFEKYDNLLCYPVQYEGNECSKNVLYFGACPNQQIDIGIEFGIKNISSQIILIGSDYIFPKTANQIIKKYIHNMNATLLDEIYVDMDMKNFDNISEKIVSTNGQNKKILIINTINGESNKYFFESLHRKFKENPTNKLKLLSDNFPIMSFSMTENDCFNNEYTYGHYFIWNYLHSDISYDAFLKTNYQNNSKIENILIQYIHNNTMIIDDPMYHSFMSVLFFINFLEIYDGNYKSSDIRNKYLSYICMHKILTSTGYLNITNNHNLQQPVYILKMDKNNQFNIIYKTPIEVYPNPFYDNFSKIKYECDARTSSIFEHTNSII